MTGRDRNVAVIVLVLAAIAAGWLLVISPKRDEASKLGGQVSAAQSQLDGFRAQLSAGEAARSAYAQSYATLARLGEAVPADDNVPSLIYQVQSAASSTRVDFEGLVLNPSSGSSPTPASSPSASQAATAALPPGASVGPAGFPIEPFTFTFRGNFFHLSSFLGRLERLVRAGNTHVSVSGRLMTLNAISLGPAPEGFPHIIATVSATTYILPASEGLTAGASTAGPAGVRAASAQAMSTPSGVPAAPATIASPR